MGCRSKVHGGERGVEEFMGRTVGAFKSTGSSISVLLGDNKESFL